MPTVNVGGDGHALYYEDSGALSTDYSTLIIVHGTAYHSAVFRRILPLAAQNRLRIILVNRRDYPGSSPYTDEDLEKVVPTNDANVIRSFYRDRANEFAEFMLWLVEHENIPIASEDGKKGGITLMAWSAGNAYTIPVLAFVDEIAASTRTRLEPYFRKLVLFDASRWTVGPGPYVEGDDPLRNPAMSPEERAEFFNTWVAGYYTHKSLVSRDISDLEMYTADASPPPTTKQLSPAELVSLTDFAAVRHSEVVVRGVDSKILADQARRAFFDDVRAKLWPKVVVDVIWCEKSAWVMVDAAWWLQTLQDEAREQGITGREVRFVMMPGANHFPHWDMPEKAVAFFAEVIGV